MSRLRAPHPVAVLVAGAAAISFSPVLVKIAVDEGVGPTSAAFWRLLLGAVPLFVAAAASRTPLRMPRGVAFLAVAAGLVFTADLYLWHRAIDHIGAGMATVLGNTQVFNTALLGWLVFRERPTTGFFAAAVLGLAGVALLTGVGSGVSFQGDYLRGVVFGLGTGLAYAGYLLTLRLLSRRSDRPPLLATVAWVSLLGAAASLLVCAGEDHGFLPRTARAWWSLAALGVLVQAAGWWAITGALPRVRGATAGLLLLLQPVLAVIWGALLFGESLGVLQVVGGSLTLAAVYLGTAKLPSRSRS